jgi:uncharacterized protein YciI
MSATTMPVPCPHAMFIVTLTYLKPVEEIDALMPGHVAWLDKGYADGLFIASGRRIPRTGGVILARSGDEAALAGYLARDPFAVHGAARFDVVEFSATKTAPGLEALRSL